MANEFIARNGVIALANSSISGSLTVSGGITGSFSGSLVGSASYATTANSASYALTASYVSGSSGSSISASYALTASYAQNAVSASFFSGSISNAVFATSASYAATASYALNAGAGGGGTVGGQALLTQSLAATTWSFQHNLGTTYPVVTVYDGATNSVIQPLNITPSGSNNINIYFSTARSGYATAVAGGGYFVTNNGTTRKLVQSTPAATWSFAHNIGDQFPAFEVYDSNNNVIIPSAIQAIDAYTAQITFAYSASGTAIATLGGGIGVGTVITVTSASSTWALQHNLNTSYPIVTIWESGSNQIIQPDTVTSIDANTISVGFTSPVKGWANVSRAGSVISGSTDWNLLINKPNVGVVYSQSTPSSTWSINHNLGTQFPLVTVYDSSNTVVLPQSIVGVDANNITITFPSPQSGTVNLSKAGNYISGSILWSNITNGPFSTTGSVTNFTGSALQVNGTNFVAGTLFGVSNQNSESIAFNPAVSASIGRILFFNNAAGTYTTARMTANNFDFQGPSNTSLMYVSASGQVGIGNNIPSYSLDVSGTGRYTGALGVGVGTSAWQSIYYIPFEVGNTNSRVFLTGRNDSTIAGDIGINAYYNNGWKYVNNGVANEILIDGGFHFRTAPSGTAGAALSWTDALYISGSGNVGIGTSSPSYALDVATASGNSYINISRASQSTGQVALRLTGGTGGTNWVIYQDTSANDLQFYGNGSERMRITSGGASLFGTSTLASFDNTATSWSIIYGSYSIAASAMQSYSARTLGLNRTQSNGIILEFLYGGTTVGSISTNTYSLPSDLNFKKDITDISLGLNLVTKLRPVFYRHKLDEDNEPLSNGIIAQELEQSLLECGIEKNSLLMLQHKPNEKQNESQYWVDYQKMIPVLVKAIQELTARVQELENK